MRSRQKKTQWVVSVLIAFMVLLAQAVSAQEKELEKIEKFIKKKRINAAYVMIGGSNLRLNNLNLVLNRMNLPTVGNYYLSYGIGGHVIHNKLVVGLELVHTLENDSPGALDFNTSVEANYGTLNFGYLLHSQKGLMLYPYTGLGLGRLTLRVTENNIHSFEDITGYQKGSDSRSTNILVNLGFAVDFFYKYNEKKKGQNNLVVGLRAGYILSPIRRHWRVNHIQVHDGPDARISGPYIRITLGLGGWMEKLIKKAI